MMADSNGTYSYTVDGIDDIEVSATFKKAESTEGGSTENNGGAENNGGTENKGDTAEKSGCGSVIGTAGFAMGLAAVAAAFVLTIVCRKKNND
jgi:hypothetical protein